MTGRRAELLCAALLLLMAVNFLAVLAQKGITTDEVVHIPAGYAYLTRRDFRPNDEHPPLVKLWAALPLLALRPAPPPLLPADTPDRRTLNNARYFWESNRARFVTLAFWARVPMVALTLALGVLIFAYARRLFGARAAVLAVALFSLEPTVLAHGRVVHTDVPAALAYLGCFVALHRYVDGLRGSQSEERGTRNELGKPPGGLGHSLHLPSRSVRSSFFALRSTTLGLALGAALATKYSLLVLVPVVVVVLGVVGWWAPRWGVARWRVAGDAALVAVVALLVVRAAYLFTNQPLEVADLNWLAGEGAARAARVEAAIGALGLVVPRYYLIGAYTVLLHNGGGHPASLLGQQGDHGWWYYFPVAFALKTALPFLLLTIGALGWGVWRLARCRDGRFLALLAPCALYTAATMASQINIGIRHLLPAFPFLFILGGAALDRLLVRVGQGKRRKGRSSSRVWRATAPAAVVALVLGWMAVEAARAYPDYMSSMNELTLGRPGWELLSDSNVEWDDDVPALARYLRDRGETGVRGALLGGRETLQYYGIEYHDILAEPPGQGPDLRYIAIGASFLNGSTAPDLPGQRREDVFAEYRSRTPEAIFGGSIYLYRARPVPPPLDAPLPDNEFRATITASGLPKTLRPGETTTLAVRIRNDGDRPWPATGTTAARYQLHLGDRWFDPSGATLERDDARAALPFPLYPGEEATLRLEITAPAQPGDYLLEIDLVQENVAWFGSHGTTPVRVRVRVQ